VLVDSHCHLDRLKLLPDSGGLPAALTQAREAGVSGFLCVCIDQNNVADVVGIADRWPDIVASVGVHPLDLADKAPDLSFLSEWARHPRVVAVGETGLDYHYASENRQLQMDSFAAHLDFAAQEKLPVIIHTREAVDDTLALMRTHASRASTGVMHCFTESWDMARQALDMGFYVSFSGIITFRNADDLREVVRQVPLDRLLIETDSPYLAPVPYRGKPNEPKYLPAVAAEVARLKGISEEEVIRVTGENFFNLFSKARGPLQAV